MRKILIISSLVVGILIIGIIGSNANSISWFFINDSIIEKNPDGINITVAEQAQKIDLGEIKIENKPTLADDGNFLFHLYIGNNTESAGEFAFMPWNEKRLLSYNLPNGGVILGKKYLFNKETKEIGSLTGQQGLTAFDYSADGNTLATVGKVSADSTRLQVIIRDVGKDNTHMIDQFEYVAPIYPEVVYLDWGNNGNLFYDSVQNGIPVIKVYDTKNSISEVFLAGAMNPQISSDKTKMVYDRINLDNKTDKLETELVLYDLTTNKVVTPISGSRKIFWADDYLIVRDVDHAALNIYDLASEGKLINQIPYNKLPFEISISDKMISIKSYSFENSIFNTVSDKYAITN